MGLLAAAPDAPADDTKEHRVGLMLEGTYEKAEIVSQLEGAKRTQLVPAYEWDYGVRNFRKADWEKQDWEWNSFLSRARKVAEEIAKRIEPRMIRDQRGVIDYALVHDDDPFLSSVLLSDTFLNSFRDSLGDQLHVIVVDRHLLYVFPATGGKIEQYGPSIVERFQTTDLPVSLEVFLVDKNGFRVIGELER